MTLSMGSIQSLIKGKGVYVLIAAVSFVILSCGAQEITTHLTDETYYFSSALGMVEKGDWLTPVFEGREERFQKPILFYWLVALSFKIFGISIFSGRLPSIILASLGVAVIFHLSLLFFGDYKGAIFSSFVLLSSSLYFLNGRAARTDMLLTFLILLSILFFKKWLSEGEKNSVYAFFSFICMGLGVMTKGPAGILIPGTTILSFLLVQPKRRKLLRDFFSPLPLFVFVLVVLPWPLAMYLRHGPKFISSFFFGELVQRIGGSPLWPFSNLVYYFVSLLRHFFPWTIFLPICVMLNAERRRQSQEGLFLLSIWCGVTFAIFTFLVSSHHSRYLLPLSPPIALLCGEYMARVEERGGLQNKTLRIPVLLILVILTLLSCLLLYILFRNSYFRQAILVPSLALIIFSGGIIALLIWFYKRKLFLPVPALVACSVLVFAFVFMAGIIPSLVPVPWKELGVNCVRKLNKADKFVTIGLERGERVWLSIYGRRLPDEIFSRERVDLARKWLKQEKCSGGTLVILPLSDYFEVFGEDFRDTCTIEGISFTYATSRAKLKEIRDAILKGPPDRFIGRYKRYYIAVMKKS